MATSSIGISVSMTVSLAAAVTEAKAGRISIEKIFKDPIKINLKTEFNPQLEHLSNTFFTFINNLNTSRANRVNINFNMAQINSEITAIEARITTMINNINSRQINLNINTTNVPNVPNVPNEQRPPRETRVPNTQPDPYVNQSGRTHVATTNTFNTDTGAWQRTVIETKAIENGLLEIRRCITSINGQPITVLKNAPQELEKLRTQLINFQELSNSVLNKSINMGTPLATNSNVQFAPAREAMTQLLTQARTLQDAIAHIPLDSNVQANVNNLNGQLKIAVTNIKDMGTAYEKFNNVSIGIDRKSAIMRQFASDPKNIIMDSSAELNRIMEQKRLLVTASASTNREGGSFTATELVQLKALAEQLKVVEASIKSNSKEYTDFQRKVTAQTSVTLGHLQKSQVNEIKANALGITDIRAYTTYQDLVKQQATLAQSTNAANNSGSLVSNENMLRLKELIHLIQMANTEVKNYQSSTNTKSTKPIINIVEAKREADEYVATLQRSFSAGQQVIHNQINEYGTLILKIRELNGTVRETKLLYDATKIGQSGVFTQIPGSERIISKPDVIARNDISKFTPEIQEVYKSFEALKLKAGEAFNVSTTPLLTSLEHLKTSIIQTENGMQKFTQTFKLNDKQTQVLRGTYDSVSGSMSKVTLSTGELLNRQIGLGEAIKLAAGKFSMWIGVSTLVMSAIHNVTEGFKFIEEMTKKFTNIQMEMTATKLNFNDVSMAANKMADSFGTTTEKVMQGIAVFGTYNATMDEVLEKTKAAVIMSNITGQSVESAADQIMASLVQFGLGANKAMSVVDIAGSVARNLAVDYPVAVREITSGLRTVGAVAREAGVPLEQLAALIGTLEESTRRSGSEIGENNCPMS